MPEKPDVSTHCIAFDRMAPRLKIVDDIWGGTESMRQAAETYLHKDLLESPERYEIRLHRSTFTNFYKKAVTDLVGRPFSKRVQWNTEKIPATIADLLPDIDRAGRHVDVFAKDVYTRAWADGLHHILIEYPNTNEEGIQNRGDEKRMGAQPYWIQLEAAQVFFWRYRLRGKRAILDEIRLLETVIEPNGFGETEVEQIRVLRPGAWEIWRKRTTRGGNERWSLSRQGEQLGAGRKPLPIVPLVTVYTGRSGYMEAVPPLIDLAHENVYHWNTCSDQQDIVHVARVPILFGAGFDDLDVQTGSKKKLKISSHGAITTKDPQAKLTYVEHSGNAIRSGEADIDRCEARIVMYSMEPLIRRKMPERTATEMGLEADVEYADLAVQTVGLEDALSYALWITGLYTGDKVPEERLVTINKDFGITAAQAADVKVLLDARVAKQISQATFLKELQRRNIMSTDVDINDEIELTKDEQGLLVGEFQQGGGNQGGGGQGGTEGGGASGGPE